MNLESWYPSLLDDCQNIVVETQFASQWTLVEGYHMLGKRIRGESGIRETQISALIDRLSTDMGKSQRSLWYSVQFFDKFPDLNLLPVGKNLTWRNICRELLPENPQPKKPRLCPYCGNDLNLPPDSPQGGNEGQGTA